MTHKILIVEDEDSQRLALQENLTFNKYQVLLARDGVEGLTVALRDRPDLIITDVRMPAMDGMAMMHKLREDGPWGQNVPIIILTNYDSDDSQLQQINIDHPTYYLLKVKTTVDKIIEKVQEVLK
jgi:two-component system response regulator YesN